MARNHKVIHYVTFILGLSILIYSVTSALVFHNSRFYTIFALGSWLVLDYIDYRINNTSILTYFINSKHRAGFLVFLFISTVGCFVVDFVLGVSVSGMWKWSDYKPINYIIMFLFMNGAYILGMYELYRLFKTLFRGRISEDHLLKLKFHKGLHKYIVNIFLGIGLVCILIPFHPLITKNYSYIEFIMLLPFIGLILISDALKISLGGRSLVNELIRLNFNLVLTFIFTSFTAALLTELINLSAQEWSYERVPFESLRVLDIPLAIFVGWLPLVISTVSIVELVKRYVFVKSNN